MAMKDDLQEIERELVESFREYKKLGKYHYSPELKRKVFDAYNLKITPERIVELCNVSLCAATNWFQLFRRHTPSFTPSTSPLFREIKISPPAQEKIITPIKENLNLIHEQRTTNSLKIKFPNGIEIRCKTSEVKNLIHDLFFIQA